MCKRCGKPWGADWRSMARLLEMDIPIWKHGAMDYLESEGLRFCVHFGTHNAVEMARQHRHDKKLRETTH